MSKGREGDAVETVRAFVAIPLEGEVCRRLVGWQSGLRRAVSGIKWVEAENLHLTLKFLGEIEVGRIGAVATALGTALAGTPRLELRFVGLGAFPSPSAPKIIWAGVHPEGGALAAARRAVEAALAALGFPREARAFVPHLTVGRVRGRPDPRLPEELARAGDRTWGTVTAGQVVLMQSTLTPRGPIYAPLAAVELV